MANQRAQTAEPAQDQPETTPVAQATHPPEALRLGLPDPVSARPGKPLSDSGQGKVTVRTAWPVDRFEHGLKGVPAVTAEGVEVDRSDAKKLLEKAAAHGLNLEEVE